LSGLKKDQELLSQVN